MRTITKVLPRRIIRSYQCSICKTKYRTPKLAEACETMPVEPKKFKIGEKVRWRELKECHCGKVHFPKGKITKIKGPLVADEEYNHKWLGGALSGMHAYYYLVAWKCPRCKEPHDQFFYSPELIKGWRYKRTRK